MKHHADGVPRSTRFLRNLPYPLGVFFSGTGLMLSGWLPNFLGLTLATLGYITGIAAYGLAVLGFYFGREARSDDNSILLNALAVAALVFLTLWIWRGLIAFPAWAHALMLVGLLLAFLHRRRHVRPSAPRM